MFVDYYAVLEISPNATAQELKAAFKRCALKYHPDRNLGVDTTEMMQLINEAYLILKDSEARSKYDREYKRFKEFTEKQAREKEASNSSQQRDEEYQKSHSQDSKKSNYYQSASFEVEDDILSKWMENARRQAVNLAKETIENFKGMSIEGGKAIGEAVIGGIFRYIGFGILMLIIFKACKH